MFHSDNDKQVFFKMWEKNPPLFLFLEKMPRATHYLHFERHHNQRKMLPSLSLEIAIEPTFSQYLKLVFLSDDLFSVIMHQIIGPFLSLIKHCIICI